MPVTTANKATKLKAAKSLLPLGWSARPRIDTLKRVAGRRPMTVDEATQLRVIQCDRAMAT